MSFDRPLALLTLLAVPAAFAVYVLVRRRPGRVAVRYPNLDVLQTAAALGRPTWRAWAAPVLLAVSLAALGVAVARPHVQRVGTDERATVVLVLDTSRSMLSDDVRPSRLEAAKAAAQSFLDRVPGTLRVALVTFSGDVAVAATPTLDHARVRETIASIDVYSGLGGGTAIGDALARAVEVGREALRERTLAAVLGPAGPESEESLVSILFLSDGRQNRGLLPPLEGAALAAAAGFPVHTVALGTSGGGSTGSSAFGFRRVPDPATLRAIARATGGEFFAAQTRESLDSAYADLGSRLGRTDRRSEATVAFVGLAAACLLGGLAAALWWSPRLP